MKAAVLNAALVGSGGFIGALCRYGVSGLVHRQLPFSTFPYGTLAVNLAGCLAIGFLGGLTDVRQLFTPEARVFALVGVLGGFTTFSSFGYETLGMLRDADYLRAGANVAVQVVLGIALVWLGYAVAGAR